MFERPNLSFGNREENPFGYFETEKFKNAVRKLEESHEIIPQHKANVLAVALDLKPAGTIDTLPLSEGQIERINQMLSELGLFFSDGNIESHNLHYFVFGNTPETIADAMQVMFRGGEDDEGYGRAMGFPESAIDAYSRKTDGDSLLEHEEKERLLTDEEKKFLGFRLSRENYEQEIEWVEQMIAAVKKYSPKIYSQIMQSD